jgi:hypothetical protein
VRRSRPRVALPPRLRIGQRGAGFQYVFLVETALNLPDDSPADLHVPSLRQRLEATIVSLEGLSVTVSVPVDIGEFVPRARLQSDLTHLLRTPSESRVWLRPRIPPARACSASETLRVCRCR